MSYVNQIGNLPFRYDVPTGQMVQYRLDAPPYIPNSINCPANVQFAIPAICSMVANEAAMRSGMHVGRMFLFNQLSSNGYINNDFSVVIATVVDILALNIAKGIYNSVESGLQDAVAKALSIYCSLNYQHFPALQSVTPPNIVNDAHNNIQAFYQLSNEIASFKQRANLQPQAPQHGFTTQYQQPGQVMLNPAFSGAPQQQYNQPAYNQPIYNQPPVRNFSSGQTNTNTGLFNNSSAGNKQPGSPVMTSDGNSRYDYLKPTKNIQQPVTGTIDQRQWFDKQIAVVNAKEGTLSAKIYDVNIPEGVVPEPILNWKPSKQQPYPLTVNTNEYRLGFREFNDNGKKTVTNYLIPLTEDDFMDRSKHIITTMGQIHTAHIPVSHGTREEALKDSVKHLFDIKKEDIELAKNPQNPLEEEAAREIETHVISDYGISNFLEEAIFDGRLKHKQSAVADVECTAFRVYKIIATPVIGDKSHIDFIDDLSRSKTFRELVSKISELMTINAEDRSLVNLCYVIDKMLTKEVNDVLRNKLSLPGITIDSFVDDVNGLPEHLATHFGDMYKRIFLEFQKEFIGNVLRTVTDDTSKILMDNLNKDPDSEAVINFLAQNYSLTYLNVEAYELAFEPYGECASVIESDNPLMYKVIEGIFNHETELDKETFRHLIITSDDVIYQVQRGLIGDNFFTICLKS